MIGLFGHHVMVNTKLPHATRAQCSCGINDTNHERVLEIKDQPNPTCSLQLLSKLTQPVHPYLP